MYGAPHHALRAWHSLAAPTSIPISLRVSRGAWVMNDLAIQGLHGRLIRAGDGDYDAGIVKQ